MYERKGYNALDQISNQQCSGSEPRVLQMWQVSTSEQVPNTQHLLVTNIRTPSEKQVTLHQMVH